MLISESLTTLVYPIILHQTLIASESHLRSLQRDRSGSFLYPTDSESRTTLVPESPATLVSMLDSIQ